MPVQIGAGVHSFSDPTGLLFDCHRRIEMFLASLKSVAETIDGPPTKESAEALTAALRYFREAAPNHTADEEESLFPRLRRIPDPEVQSALAKLDELQKDHRWAAPLHDEVERLGQQYLSQGTLSAQEADIFREDVTRLGSMYGQHIATEDNLVFPLAARVLSQKDRIMIAQEMAARRKVRLVTDISRAHG
jgi:hemerythrin-like domain-containing protein